MAQEQKPRRALLSILSKAAIVLFSIGFTLLLLEVVMRVGFDALPPQIQGQIQNVRVVPWDDRSIVPPVPFEPDTNYQARLAPGYVDYPVRWRDARFRFSTVNLWDHPVGLRTSDSPRWPIDIMAFGDSFTFCWTAAADCWVQKLQNDYGWSVINAGQPGTGPTGQLRLMTEVGVPIEPRLVVWQRYSNDPFDDYVLHWIRDEAPGLSSAPAVDPARELQGLERYSALLVLLNNILNPPETSNDYEHSQTVEINGRQMIITTDEYTNSTHSSYPATEWGWEHNIEAYENGVQMMQEEIGTETVFVIIPLKEEAYADQLTDHLSEEYLTELAENRQIMLEECESHGWHCIDTLPALREAVNQGETVYYAGDFHLDASGNAIVAQLVQEYITENDLLPG